MAGRKKRAGPINYFELPRKQLQTLCKKHGFPANKTNVLMAEFLTAHLGSEENLNQNSSLPSEDEMSECQSQVVGSEITVDDSQLNASESQPLDSREEADFFSATSVLHKDAGNDQALSRTKAADVENKCEVERKALSDDTSGTTKFSKPQLAAERLPRRQNESKDARTCVATAQGIPDRHSRTEVPKKNASSSCQDGRSRQKDQVTPLPISVMPYACHPTPPQSCSSGKQETLRRNGAATTSPKFERSRSDLFASMVQSSPSILERRVQHDVSSRHATERCHEFGEDPTLDRSCTDALSRDDEFRSAFMRAAGDEASVGCRGSVTEPVEAALRMVTPLDPICSPLKVTFAVPATGIIPCVDTDPGRSRIVEEWGVEKTQQTINLDEDVPTAQRSLERSIQEQPIMDVESQPLKDIVNNSVLHAVTGGEQSRKLYSLSRKDSYKSSALTRASRIAADVERASKMGQNRRLEILASKRALGVGNLRTDEASEDTDLCQNGRVAAIELHSTGSSLDVALNLQPCVSMAGTTSGLLDDSSADALGSHPDSQSTEEWSCMDFILSQEAVDEASTHRGLEQSIGIRETVTSEQNATEAAPEVPIVTGIGSSDRLDDDPAVPLSESSSDAVLDPVFSALPDVVEIPKGDEEEDMDGPNHTRVVSSHFESHKTTDLVDVGCEEAALRTLSDQQNSRADADFFESTLPSFPVNFARMSSFEICSAANREPRAVVQNGTRNSLDQTLGPVQLRAASVDLSKGPRSKVEADDRMSEGGTQEAALAQRTDEVSPSQPSWMTAPIVVPAKKLVNRKTKEKLGSPLLSPGQNTNLMEEAAELLRTDGRGKHLTRPTPDEIKLVGAASRTQRNVEQRHKSVSEPSSNMALIVPPPGSRNKVGPRMDGSAVKEGMAQMRSTIALPARSSEPRTSSQQSFGERRAEVTPSRKALSFLDIDFTKPCENAAVHKTSALNMLDTNWDGVEAISEGLPHLITTATTTNKAPADDVVQDALRAFEEKENKPGGSPVCGNDTERSTMRQEQYKGRLAGKSKQKALKIAEKNAAMLREHVLKQRRMDQKPLDAFVSVRSSPSPLKQLPRTRFM